MKEINASSRSGFALLFILGVLALQSVIAVTLLRFCQMEASEGRNYSDRIRARLAAESGVDYGIRQIQSLAAGPIPEATLAGWSQGMNSLGIIRAEAVETRSEQDMALDSRSGYRVTIHDESGKLNINDDNSVLGSGERRLERIVRSLHEILFPEHADDSQTVAHRIFYDPAFGRDALPEGRFSSLAQVEQALRQAGMDDAAVARMLDVITINSWQDPHVLRPNLLVYGGNRPVSIAGQDAELTLNTVTCNPASAVSSSGNLQDLVGLPVDLQLAIQSRNMELSARAPVNVNTARVELIQALLMSVEGIYLQEGPAESQSAHHYAWWSTNRGAPDRTVACMGWLNRTLRLDAPRAARLAYAIYNRVHGTRLGPSPDDLAGADPSGHAFGTWEEFRDFLEHGLTETAAFSIHLGENFNIPESLTRLELPGGRMDPHAVATQATTVNLYRQHWMDLPISARGVDDDAANHWWKRYFLQAQLDALYANFNPNSLLNDFNPNANVHGMVDKAQLLSHGTEFCFEPSGTFQIDAQGMVYGAANDIVAEARNRVLLRAFLPVRITSQSQFLEGLEQAEDVANFFNAAQDPFLTEAWKCAHSIDGTSYTLQSYPEALLIGQESRIRNCRWDGNLMLATQEFQFDHPLPPDVAVSGLFGMTGFLSHFNPNPRTTNGAPRTPLQPNRVDNAAQTFQSQILVDGFNRPSTQPLFPADAAAQPGNLYPDGLYCEKGRTLAHRMHGFYDGTYINHRYLAFWLKPNFHTGIATRIRKFLAGPSRAGTFGRQQFLALYYLTNCASADERYRSGAESPDAPKFLHGSTAANQWVPTHCLAFGWAWQKDSTSGTYSTRFVTGRTATHAVTRDYPQGAGNSAPMTPDSQNMPGHQWSLISCGWRFSSSNSQQENAQSLAINGHFMPWEQMHPRSISAPYHTAAQFTALPAAATRDQLVNEWLRFGELPPADPRAAHASPYYADATIDEIVGMKYPSNFPFEFAVNPLFFQAGRYYSLTRPDAGGVPCVAVYTTPEIRLSDIPVACSRATRWRARSCAWTYYRSRHNRAGFGLQDDIADTLRGVPVNPNDRRDPMIDAWAADVAHELSDEDRAGSRQWDPVSVDITTSDGAWLCQTEIGDLSRRMTDPAGSAPPTETSGNAYYSNQDSFRLRVYFHLAAGQAIHESPVLDDLTITLQGERPIILEWREIR